MHELKNRCQKKIEDIKIKTAFRMETLEVTQKYKTFNLTLDCSD